MAINKPAKTHGALRNCIEYVLREHKTEEALVYMTDPAPEILDSIQSINHSYQKKDYGIKTVGECVRIM